MNAITTMWVWLRARADRDEKGVALLLEALAISVVGIVLLLAFLPAARTFVTDVVDWVRENTIGA